MKFTKEYDGANWRGKDVTRNTRSLISGIIAAFDLEELSNAEERQSRYSACTL